MLLEAGGEMASLSLLVLEDEAEEGGGVSGWCAWFGGGAAPGLGAAGAVLLLRGKLARQCREVESWRRVRMRPCRAHIQEPESVFFQRKDWPQRRVVSMQSSVRGMGSLCQGVCRRVDLLVMMGGCGSVSIQDDIATLRSPQMELNSLKRQTPVSILHPRRLCSITRTEVTRLTGHLDIQLPARDSRAMFAPSKRIPTSPAGFLHSPIVTYKFAAGSSTRLSTALRGGLFSIGTKTNSQSSPRRHQQDEFSELTRIP